MSEVTKLYHERMDQTLREDEQRVSEAMKKNSVR